MRKLILFLVPLLLLIACEEYYTPAIDKRDGTLVVDALVTNDASKNYVRLTYSMDFYSRKMVQPVTGATVDMVEAAGTVTAAKETGTGYFSFVTLPVAGKKYKLRIMIGKDVYESEQVTMPPVPSITKLYHGHKEQKVYRTDGFGNPLPYTVAGREFYIDAPVTASLSNYRFYIRSVIEWSYFPPALSGPPPPPIFGWNSFYDNSSYNIAGTTKISAATSKIEEHPIRFFSYNAQDYLRADSLNMNGWIMIIDQFGTSSGSYDYHQKLNNQLLAEGSLFDPIQTQIYGNISCKSDPAKLVFGYFDLNSYLQHRYYTNFSSPETAVTLRKLNSYPLIPEEGQVLDNPPSWWQ